MSDCIEVRNEGDLDEEDVMRFDHSGRTFAVCRDDSGAYFAIDGLCSHENVHLAEGFVFGDFVESPRHQGRFKLCDGSPCGGPVVEPLKSYPIQVRDGKTMIDLQ
jgi:3-phenylpropionate/trans-cinnamate dioxygenase ferredoxin subunit